MSKSTSDEGEGGDALIHLRVSPALKGRWVRESRAAGMRLTDWIVKRVESQCRELKDMRELLRAKLEEQQ